jgi:hypothetical protein
MARALQQKKRKYQSWPGAVAAAAELCVTYSHLRRILAGERQSRSLLSRYRSLSAEQAARPRETTELDTNHEPTS